MSQGTSLQINRYFGDFGLNNLFPYQADKKCYADDCLNCQSQYSEGIEKRQGFQVKANGIGGYGILNYTYTDWKQNLVEQMLVVDPSGLYVLNTGTLNITYSGSSARAVVSIQVVSGNFVLTLVDAGATVLTQNLGAGYEETSPVTLSSLATAINGVSNFSATVTGDSTVSAAFLDITPELSIAKGTTNKINFNYYTIIRSSYVTFSGVKSELGTSKLSNVSAVNYKGYAVFADGGPLKVYDGSMLYLAGLPTPALSSILPSVGAGNLTGSYYYFFTYGFTDNQGNISESAWSPPMAQTVQNAAVSITVPTLDIYSGYNTNYATLSNVTPPTPLTNGLVTLTVYGTHTFVPGNYIYFFNSDAATNAYKSYVVSAVTYSTITVQSTATIAITDSTIASNGLYINIYRQASNSTVRYLLVSMTNDPTVSNLTYIDNPRYATVGGSPYTASSSGGQIAVSVINNNFKVGDVIDPPSGSTSGGVALATGTTYTVAASTNTVLTLYSLNPLTVPANGVFVLDNLTYPIFTGNLLPFNGNVPRRDPPPNADVCAVFNDQLVIGQNQYIYWSDTSEPLVSDSGLQFNITQYFGTFHSQVTALGQNGQNLIIWQKRRIDKYVCSDLIFDTIAQYQVSDKIGCIGDSGVVTIGSRLFFLDQSGVYEMNSGNIALNKPTYTYSSQGVQLNSSSTIQDQLAASTGLGGAISRDVVNYFNGYYPFAWSRSVLGCDEQNNFLFVYLPIENSSSFGWETDSSVCLVYETRTDRWYKWGNFNLAGGMASDSNYNLYFVERHYGKSLRVNTNKFTRRWDNYAYYDHTQPIRFMYRTKYDYLNGAVGNNKKTLKELKLYNIPRLATDYLHTPTIGVTILKDYVDVQHSTLSYTFPAQSTPWGFLWNTVPYWCVKPPFESLFPATEAGEVFTFIFENNDPGMNCKISGWALQWLPRTVNMRE